MRVLPLFTAVLTAHALRSREVCTPIPRVTGLDEVAYAMMTERICKINWVLTRTTTMPFLDVRSLGCWKLEAFNTETRLSSGVYRNVNDGRCVLVFSGYHGKLTGPMMAITELAKLPPKRTSLCGNTVYEPFVDLARRHMALANWSNVANTLASCKHVTATAESVGGSIVEMTAGCAASDQLSELQPPSLPSFAVHKLFTFGSIGSSMEPIRNPKREDGCWDGARLYINGDLFSGMLGTFGFQHARMDAMEIFHTQGALSRRNQSCTAPDTTRDNLHRAPPPTEAVSLMRNKDWTNHEVTTYLKDLELFMNVSWEDKGRPEAENPERMAVELARVSKRKLHLR